MAYKVLGQVTAAATTETAINLVKNPTFENIVASATAATTTATALALAAGGTDTYWKITSPSTLTNYYASSTYTAPVSGDGGTTYYGLRLGRGTSATTGVHTLSYGTTTAAGGTTPDTSIAIPVTAGTTYYWGGYFSRNSATYATNPTLDVNWYDNSLTALSTSSLTMSSPTTGTYTRTTTSAAAPTNATWATINLKVTQATTNQTMIAIWDGIHFSTLSATNTTFPQPISTAGSDAVYISPYDAILTNKWSGTSYASATVQVNAVYSTLYTVPANSSAIVSSITITNTSTSAANYRITVLPASTSRDIKHHIVYNALISPNETQYYTNGITLGAGDKIEVQADNTSVAFTAFGSEN